MNSVQHVFIHVGCALSWMIYERLKPYLEESQAIRG